MDEQVRKDSSMLKDKYKNFPMDNFVSWYFKDKKSNKEWGMSINIPYTVTSPKELVAALRHLIDSIEKVAEENQIEEIYDFNLFAQEHLPLYSRDKRVE